MFEIRLKAAREARGYSQEELGDMIGVAKLQVYRWEKARNAPDVDTVSRLAKVLAVSADYLLGLTSNSEPRMTTGDLSPRERAALSAWRRGDKLEAVRVIITEE